MKGPTTKAKVINLKQEKILVAGLALLVGAIAISVFSSKVLANEPVKKSEEWQPHSQIDGEIKLPFELKVPKVNH